MNTSAFNFATTCQVIQSTCQIFLLTCQLYPFKEKNINIQYEYAEFIINIKVSIFGEKKFSFELFPFSMFFAWIRIYDFKFYIR